MTSGITIPVGELQALVGKAILESLSADTRATILEEAIKYLITPRTKDDGYGRSTIVAASPLQLAFNQAIERLSREVADELAAECKPRLAIEMRTMLADMPDSIADEWDVQSKLFRVLVGKGAELADERRLREQW